MEKLYQKFEKEIKPELQKELGLTNVFEVPKFEKVVISAGVGDLKESQEMINKASEILAKIAGLKPKVNRSRKAVSAFKLRIGQVVGLTVTLRGERMYDFIDRLVNVALPRVRDFRGLPKKAFDKHGNYTVGIKDAVIFPELGLEDAIPGFGFQVNIKTNAGNDKNAELLLQKLGFPFEKGKKA